jgi:hypothetical protein
LTPSLLQPAAKETFDVASYILHFVGDKPANDPRDCLEKCVKWIHACGIPESKDPLYTLDFCQWYRQLLSGIRPSELRISNTWAKAQFNDPSLFP